MKAIVLAISILVVSAAQVLAQDATCTARAVGSDGKPLAGAAKTSFMKKCKSEACEPKAVDKAGKPLVGAAKTSFMKKCEAGA